MGVMRCLMLVEGPYDRQRLSTLINLFDSSRLVLVPFGTDVLCEKDYFSSRDKKISALLSKEKTNELSDFDEIVQICDIDGCFIDDQYVIEDTGISHIKYEHKKIRAINVSSLIKVRINKRNNINALLEENKIKLFYNSTNIDHAFDGIQNPNPDQKRTKAILMYLKYKNDGESLLRELISLCPVPNDYFESWNYIKRDFNSLTRCSNILHFVLDHREFLKLEYKKFIEAFLETLEKGTGGI